MIETIPLDGPIDLAALDDFLASDRAPPDPSLTVNAWSFRRRNSKALI
jgi:hypothetical protein